MEPVSHQIPSESDALHRIGVALRRARKDRGMTLEALAEGAGLSSAFLSRLERGQVSCSIGNLLHLAGVLGLAPSAIFAGLDQPPGNDAYRVARADQNDAERESAKSNPHWRRLASGTERHLLEAFALSLDPKSADAMGAPLVSHPGEEFCFVIEGSVRFRIGDETVELGPGDSIHLRSDLPHMAWPLGSAPARLLMVTAIENHAALAVEWWSRTTEANPKEEIHADKGKRTRAR